MAASTEDRHGDIRAEYSLVMQNSRAHMGRCMGFHGAAGLLGNSRGP